MARLIDADTMREQWLENGENEYVYDTNAILDSIDAQPTVDAVEVVHGRWLYYSTTMMECPNCHRHTARHKYKYCPHCGAVMEDKYNEAID